MQHSCATKINTSESHFSASVADQRVVDFLELDGANQRLTGEVEPAGSIERAAREMTKQRATSLQHNVRAVFNSIVNNSVASRRSVDLLRCGLRWRDGAKVRLRTLPRNPRNHRPCRHARRSQTVDTGS
jgi:hypothetical protein